MYQSPLVTVFHAKCTRGRGGTRWAMSMLARGMRMYASRSLASAIGLHSLDLVPRATIVAGTVSLLNRTDNGRFSAFTVPWGTSRWFQRWRHRGKEILHTNRLCHRRHRS